jgi:hypothetical protein
MAIQFLGGIGLDQYLYYIQTLETLMLPIGKTVILVVADHKHINNELLNH